MRVGGPRVVAVLQPGALGRARGRHRADGRRGGRDKARRSPVHCGRNDGDDVAHLLHPGPEPRPRRRGGGGPSPVQRTAARVDGRRDPARVRSVHAHPNWRHQRRGRFGSPLAVDADSRATPPRPGRQRAGAPPAPAAAAAADARLPAKTTDQPAVPTSSPAAAKVSGEERRRSRRGEHGRRLARLSRTEARRRHSRRADRNRLVPVEAGRTVAQADRTGLVVLRGPRRSHLHPGAARRRRNGVVLRPDHRRAGVETQRRGSVLRVERRRRSARDADLQQRSRLHVWRDRNPERARRS